MFKFLKKRKAQSTMEYAILIIIIIGALLSIQVYIKRGVQGRLRSAADDIGEQFSVGNTNTAVRTLSFSHTNDTYTSGVTRSALVVEDETSNTTVSTNLLIMNQESWGGV